MAQKHAAEVRPAWRAGRGLKRFNVGHTVQGIRVRPAWRAGRGLKPGVTLNAEGTSSSPRMACGAWIETCIHDPHARTFWVRPAWRAGRGLRGGAVLGCCRFDLCSPRMACG